MIILLILLLIISIGIHASHFNGGTITWAPVDPNANSSPVVITITQSYSWSYPTISCTTNVPVSSGKSDGNLTCITNCSTDGGYSSAPISILTDCTSYSSTLGIVSSERSVNITLNAGAYFYIAYTGGNWRNLYSTSTGGLDWSIVTLINLQFRPDGIVNTPPISDVLSPQYVIVNTTTLIDIPVSDVNIGDDIRCRWGVNNGSINECSNVCYDLGGLPSGTVLSNCILTFTGLVANKCYPIALQIEDFINKTSTVPMSSVPVQILICVEPTPSCTISPAMVPMTDCLEVQVGVATNFTLYITNLCNSSATITEVIISKKISGMTASSVKNSTTNTLSYIQLTWTPQSSQVGIQELCAYAYNSFLVRSTQYCATFTVTTSSPNCPTTTVAAVSTNNTSSNNNNSNGMNIPLIVGLSLLALSLALCCCCCWLYHFFWGAAGRRRQEKIQSENKIEKQKYLQWLPLFITRNLPFKKVNNNYLFHQMSNDRNSASVLRSSGPTSLLSTSKDQSHFTTFENHRNNNINQPFTKEIIRHSNSTTRIPKNKVSTVFNTAPINDNQRTDRSNNINTANSNIGVVTNEDADTSMHYNESLNAIKLNGGENSTIEKSQVKKIHPPTTVTQRRSRSINVHIVSQPVTGKTSSKSNSVTVIRVSSLSNDRKRRQSNGTSKVHGDNEEHKNNKNLKELEIVKSKIICPTDVNDFTQLIQTLAKSKTLSHLNLTGTSILLNQLMEFFEILRSNRTLKVLNIRECVIDSTNQLLKQHIKQLHIENPFIEILHDNQ
ncbi:unnamed protein product [Rotaria sp. Silwood1]|nr:unnamed protein product [Rotaria sp. Silwood1]